MDKTNISTQEDTDDEDVSGNKLVKGIESIFIEITLLSRFVFQFFRNVFTPPYELNELLKQCYIVGYKSLPLVGVTGFITNKDFSARQWTKPRIA
jgi:ABC-type transporter Mla maintaining outer membrane lipid asymmetry permease subunit MlaE